MRGCNEDYCNAAIVALLAAASNLYQMTVNESLERTVYGKGDTLGLDAVPEIEIVNCIQRYDPDAVFITEELGREMTHGWDTSGSPMHQPVIFFCDPTDRSSELKRFLERFKESRANAKVGDLIQEESSLNVYAEIGSTPLSITGSTSAISCIKAGDVIFAVIFNYITGELYLACSAGIYRYACLSGRTELPASVTVSEIIAKGEKITFPSLSATSGRYENWKRYVTFLGKSGYAENFRDSMIFIDPAEELRHYDRPGGPSRILYLSDLQPAAKPVGFILANGEKIGEWIHWLPFVRYSYSRGARSLVLFEVFHERPWTKEGILMSTAAPYSIFQPIADHEDFMFLDVNQLAKFENPSRFRSTLLVASVGNEWALHTMRRQQYRLVNLRPTQTY